MTPEAFAKVRLLADLGFASSEAVEVRGAQVLPRDLLVALMADYVPPLDAFLQVAADPTRWTKEIVTEIAGSKDGQELTYRMGTLTPVGSLPTGVAPSIVAQWLAAGRLDGPGVFPPEIIVDPEAFFAALEERGIVTQVSVTKRL
jgi:saccharopine dehydrogenase-like NADP-dependent oxidoreductase